VAGVTSQADQTCDFLALRYTSSGALSWSRTSEGTNEGIGEANALALDPAGRVAVTGRMGTMTAAEDFMTVAFSASGDTVWRWPYDGPASGFDAPTAIVAVPGGYVVTGMSTGIGTGLDFATIRFDSSSSVVSVPRTTAASDKFSLRRASPNPARDVVAFDLACPLPGEVEVSVFDVQGRSVGAGFHAIPLVPGTHRVRLDVSQLPAGLYLARVQGRNGNVSFDRTFKITLRR
jgi:type IX secretion system substrate protein